MRPTSSAARTAGVAGATLAAAGAAVLVGAAAAPAHDGFEFFAELCVPAVSAAILAVSLALFARAWRTAGAAALVGLALCGVAAPVWRSPGQPAADVSSRPVKLFVANVGRDTADPSALLASVRAAKPDVVALVEVPESLQPVIRDALSEFPHRADAGTTWDRRNGARGGLVLSRWPLRLDPPPPPWTATSAERAAILQDLTNPAAVVRTDVVVVAPDAPFRLVAVHVMRPWPFSPTGSYAAKIGYIEGVLGADRSTPLVVAGDFNATPRRTALRDAMRRSGLVAAPTFPGTWPAALPGPLRIGIDNVFAGRGASVVDRALARPTGSDHRAVVVHLAIRPQSGRSSQAARPIRPSVSH